MTYVYISGSILWNDLAIVMVLKQGLGQWTIVVFGGDYFTQRNELKVITSCYINHYLFVLLCWVLDDLFITVQLTSNDWFIQKFYFTYWLHSNVLYLEIFFKFIWVEVLWCQIIDVRIDLPYTMIVFMLWCFCRVLDLSFENFIKICSVMIQRNSGVCAFSLLRERFFIGLMDTFIHPAVRRRLHLHINSFPNVLSVVFIEFSIQDLWISISNPLVKSW